ncbi:MAG: RDD family protein [Candidatus Heimdallarchaeota archaeon]
MTFVKELKPSMFKRLLSAVIEYGLAIIMLIAGGVLEGTARSSIEIIAGVCVQLLAIGQFFMVRIPLLYSKKVFSGITAGKQLAKLRVVKLVDKERMIIQPFPKDKKGVMIGRAFISFLLFLTLPLYFIVTFFTIIFSKYNRSLLDVLTGTIVINFDNKAEMEKLND